MPGSSLPSRNSRLAPPPVEMCVKRSVDPSSSTAATESPPPTTTVAPSSAWPRGSAPSRACRRRRSAPRRRPAGRSRRPSSPAASASSNALIDCGPMSTTDHELGILCAGTILCSAPRVTSLATTTSVGSRICTPLVSASSRMRLRVVDAVALQQALADGVALGHEERVGHPAADDERVDAVHQVLEHGDLAADLGAADDRGERPLRVLQQLREDSDLALHEQARRRRAGSWARRRSRHGRGAPCRTHR